jgi:hypothetical protein
MSTSKPCPCLPNVQARRKVLLFVASTVFKELNANYLAGVQAADFNALSPTYGYVRGKAKAMVTAPKKN